MGRESNFKELRKQLRTVVKEIVPEVLTAELVAAVEKRLLNDVFIPRLNAVDERQKDLHSMLLRGIVDLEAKTAKVAEATTEAAAT